MYGYEWCKKKKHGNNKKETISAPEVWEKMMKKCTGVIWERERERRNMIISTISDKKRCKQK